MPQLSAMEVGEHGVSWLLEMRWDICSWHDLSLFVTVPPWCAFSCGDGKGGVAFISAVIVSKEESWVVEADTVCRISDSVYPKAHGVAR